MLLASPTHKIFKRKKKKKKKVIIQVEVSRKSSFLEKKYYPNRAYYWWLDLSIGSCFEMAKGGDFFSKTEGLNFTFLKPELTFTFFYLFFYFPFDREVSVEGNFKNVRLYKRSSFKIAYSFLLFDFVGVLNCFIGIVNFSSKAVK